MITIQVNIDDAGARAAVERVMRTLTAREALHHDMGLAVEHQVQTHFRRLPGRSFWKKAAESTRMVSSAQMAEVAITQRGVALRYYGGTVRPSGRISDVTGKPIRNLALPVGMDTPPVGEYGGLLAYVPNKRGGKKNGYFVEGEKHTITRGKNKGKETVRAKSSGALLYVLRTETKHEADKSVLPDEQTLGYAAAEAAGIHLKAAYDGKGDQT